MSVLCTSVAGVRLLIVCTAHLQMLIKDSEVLYMSSVHLHQVDRRCTERNLSVDPAGVSHTLLRVFSVKVLLFHRKSSAYLVFEGITVVKSAGSWLS